MQTQIGDKVRLKIPIHVNERGVVVDVTKRAILVEVAGNTLETKPEDFTNLSLAARKAWESMPDRRVGRPKGSFHCDRVSVTLRIDRELWDDFRRLEAEGAIQDRTATINALIREKTKKLKNEREVQWQSE
ncbi:MAG: hypothetical protein OXR72_09440 [Gemmatimonadota bacterium]|nr:hypothetical protein [Gemmatimonadota bacterium]